MAHIHEKIDFVIVVYIVFEDKVLMVLHKKLKKWLPIGGHIELDENPEEALFREVKEECGLEIELLSQKPEQLDDITRPLYPPAFMDMHKTSDTHHHIGMIYFAKAKSSEVKHKEDEHDGIRWFTESELDDPQYDVLKNVKFYAKEAFRRTR
ncbi:MAG: hypothetical protein A2655_04260 [Candidatus Yanofskybacteria bacterium RIFCSPHIGHO2_01_FULL_43_42]|uniref:Nudix hydrolase domain-containing protein n=1 Tax=Candidatus Yanofskybacteria bacterium RIFCSPLOWO2_01_FULL_43_22 TaxID=1802695 RepID=A0A1F8GFT2_9BACT|nr:MAG: hypothetical protein A2655_04260 [Candidatus Yanofskybacteria bacterium RIFCSPHIGHO2_01_FULL_43_42]OGN12707.1 MAG: hypothetical protein A3D48_01610 [Candidatus Yanofskybacteria bacterium RIFCSPHIGHO2_02_FULL_43_17]OGN23329.1 MAG: hypothetical protein A3A13_04380 [Candidatus Yanofskybacteria bacterium RIFCSPLOWO2_01_FULL_43_22]